MKLSAILGPLLDAKADHELIRQILLAHEAEQTNALERRRQADADRQSRKRERDKSRDITLRHSDSALVRASITRVEDKPLPTETEPQENKKELSAQARLEGVLDAEHAKAVIDHRQRLRKPLTAYAAKLLADKLATFQDPSAAVDRMIERGWQTVYPDDRPQARGSPKLTLADGFSQFSNFAEARNGPEPPDDFGRAHQALPDLSLVRNG